VNSLRSDSAIFFVGNWQIYKAVSYKKYVSKYIKNVKFELCSVHFSGWQVWPERGVGGGCTNKDPTLRQDEARPANPCPSFWGTYPRSHMEYPHSKSMLQLAKHYLPNLTTPLMDWAFFVVVVCPNQCW